MPSSGLLGHRVGSTRLRRSRNVRYRSNTDRIYAPQQPVASANDRHSASSTIHEDRARYKAAPLTAAKGTSVILALNQYNCIGCSPGKHPDTGTMAPGSDDDSRESVHGRCLCISV